MYGVEQQMKYTISKAKQFSTWKVMYLLAIRKHVHFQLPQE